MINTSIIIPTQNNWLMVQDCINAILQHTNNYEIIFVIDSSVTFRNKLAEYGRIVMDDQPFVFSRRINLGIQAAKGKYICLLNSDTVPVAGWLDKLIATDRRLGPGLVGSRCQRNGCSNVHSHGEGPELYTNYTINMFCMLASRRTFDVIGSLDERFIHYGGEDDDYCLRALRHGFRLMISDGYVYHKVGGGFDSSAVQHLLPMTHKVFIDKWGVDLPIPPRESWSDDTRIYASIKPLISILIPTRNHHKYIYDSIMSVYNQLYKNIQIIVGVDGNDQKETHSILSKLRDMRQGNRFIILESDRLGSCNIRNLCFDHSDGEFIALMDSDDIMLPDRLNMQLKAMDPLTDIVHSAFILESKDGVKNDRQVNPINREQLLQLESCVAGGTFLMRRYCLDQSRFDETYARAFDYEYVLRNMNRFSFKYCQDPAIIYRRHSDEHLSGNNESYKLHKKIIVQYKGAI